MQCLQPQRCGVREHRDGSVAALRCQSDYKHRYIKVGHKSKIVDPYKVARTTPQKPHPIQQAETVIKEHGEETELQGSLVMIEGKYSSYDELPKYFDEEARRVALYDKGLYLISTGGHRDTSINDLTKTIQYYAVIADEETFKESSPDLPICNKENTSRFDLPKTVRTNISYAEQDVHDNDTGEPIKAFKLNGFW